MKRLLILSALTLAVGATPARAASFNFETTVIGTYASLTMTDSGLTMTLTRTSGSNFSVAAVDFGAPAGWGAIDLENFDHGFPAGDEYNANFSTGISLFSIQFGDFGPSDNDTPVQLRAFSGLNGTGVELDVHSVNWLASDGFPNFKTLTVQSATPILSVQFFGSGPVHNSLYWDNITTREDVATVPEPVTLALLGSGLLGTAALRRRRR